MVKVLLVTTGHNAVRDTLAAMGNVDLCVADINEHLSGTKESFLSGLRDLLHESAAQVLITWRCPYILPQEIFSIPEYGAFNLHPSLLPRYPGLNPWDEIYRNGETATGVTLHRMTDRIDSGEIISQVQFSILDMEYERAREISDRTAAAILESYTSA